MSADLEPENTPQTPVDQKQETKGETIEKSSLMAHLKKRILVFSLLGVLLVGGIVLAARVGVGELALRKTIDYWIETQEAQTRAQGGEIDISYSEISLEGGLSDRYIIIKNPVVKVASQGETLAELGDDATKLTTARILLYPEGNSLESMRIELPDALEIYEHGGLTPGLSVKSDTPLLIALSQEVEQGTTFRTISHYLPVVWHIAHQPYDSETGELQEKETYSVHFDEGGRYFSRHASQGRLSEGSFQFSQVEVHDKDDKALFTLARFATDWKGVLTETNERLQSLNIALENLRAAPSEGLHAYTPIAFEARLGLSEFPLEKAIEEEEVSPEQSVTEEDDALITRASLTHRASLVIEQFEAKAKDTRLQVRGGLNTDGQETIPFGHLVVQLDNIAALLRQLETDTLIKPYEIHVTQAVVDQIAGQEKTDLASKLNFVVAREEGSAFVVGKSTFEALLGVIFQAALEKGKIAPQKATEAK